jgi:predicted lipid-binding transport protein (Tim44 family)
VVTKLGTWMLVAAMALSSADVWAKRLGGGGSMGKQSSNVTQRQAAPQAPAQPAPAQTPNQAAAPTAPAGAAAGAAAKPQRPWGAMLGGLAAGLGLAWLASALGFGEAFAQFLLILLLAMVVAAAIAWGHAQSGGGPLRPGAPRRRGRGGGTRHAARLPASPRRQRRVGPAVGAQPQHLWHGRTCRSTGQPNRCGPERSQTWGIPAGFDTEGFLRASKANFIQLQDAWDRGDIPALRAMMTDEMVEQIQAQLAERERHSGGAPNKTEVVTLDAQLLGIEELDDEYMASVEFSGLIRENPAEGPAPFREVWNITRPKNGRGGWLVAGVQALQ